MKDIIIQTIGFVAMALTISAPLYKKRSHILLSQYSGNALWCVHYFMLGAFTGLVMNFLNVIRGIIFSINKKWAKSIAWVFVFCGASIALGVYTFSSWYSILPIIGTVLATIALFVKNENTLRKVYVFSIPFWIVYNILIHSLSGALSACFTLISFIISIIRYSKNKQNSACVCENNSSVQPKDILGDK